MLKNQSRQWYAGYMMTKDQIEKRRVAVRKWRKANPEKHRASVDAWQKAHPKRKRERDLIRQYGISLLEYNALLEKQNRVCAICHSVPEQGSLCVDHDHSTSKIRGLLCHACNVALGNFRDSKQFLKQAISYLEAHDEQFAEDFVS